jgi:hypothetical protein
MFQAILAHLQEALRKRHSVYCVRVISVGFIKKSASRWFYHTDPLKKLVTNFHALYASRMLIFAFTQPSTCPYPDPDQFKPCPQSCYSKINFNITFLSTPSFFKQALPHQNPVFTSPLSHAYYMPRWSHSSWSNHPSNVWYGEPTVQLFVSQSSLLPCYII